jgi:RHH-type transcriptional regulator, proline utilization regulon repressor / proline dehydrogenase / delta 1-pyrroline-5-carboxylate dehydrogenase
MSTAARAAAAGVGLTVVEAPVLANGRLELRWYLREQAVSQVLHRYGNVIEPMPPG